MEEIASALLAYQALSGFQVVPWVNVCNGDASPTALAPVKATFKGSFRDKSVSQLPRVQPVERLFGLHRGFLGGLLVGVLTLKPL